VRRFNVFTAEPEYDADDPEGYRAGMARFGRSIGAEMLGGTVYELPEGQSVCPYHYEHGDEEWLLVLDGHPSVRHPDGEEQLEPGDAVCFPAGPEGAHQVVNRASPTARVLMLSTLRLPAVCVYPDSGKIGVFTEGKRDDVIVRRESGVGYWEGEVRG
jgi:uncharacterized cupin superfamily protein